MGQVRALADRLGALERIDVLVNNAGLMAGQRRVTADGFDEVFAVNHLAPFLLTNLLLGKLTAAGPARVITVTSDAHTAARLDLDDLQLEHGWQSWRAYANSKLANILFTRELARRLDGSAVTANCAHPGLVRTRFGREARLPMRAAVTLARPFMRSPRRGARHHRLPGDLPAGGRRDGRLLRQQPAARAVTGRPRRRDRPPAVAAQRGTDRPHPGTPCRDMKDTRTSTINHIHPGRSGCSRCPVACMVMRQRGAARTTDLDQRMPGRTHDCASVAAFVLHGWWSRLVRTVRRGPTRTGRIPAIVATLASDGPDGIGFNG